MSDSDTVATEIDEKLEPLLQRNKELDELFGGLFESKVTGVISEERYKKLAASFQAQQEELDIEIYELQSELKKIETKEVFPERFITLAKTYSKLDSLDRNTLYALIDYIEVFHAEKLDGQQLQTVKIHYNYVGYLELSQTFQNIISFARAGRATRYVPYSKLVGHLGREMKFPATQCDT